SFVSHESSFGESLSSGSKRLQFCRRVQGELVRTTRTLGWAIAGCSASCLATLLVLAPAFQAPSARMASARPAMHPTGGNSQQPGPRTSCAPHALVTHHY